MKIPPLDTGIEQILWEAGLSEGKLPEASSLLPSESPPENYLFEILYARSFDEYVLDLLVPRLNHREITIPSRFQSIIEDIRAELTDIRERAESPEARTAMGSVLEILQEHRDLVDMLNMYRKLLMQA